MHLYVDNGGLTKLPIWWATQWLDLTTYFPIIKQFLPNPLSPSPRAQFSYPNPHFFFEYSEASWRFPLRSLYSGVSTLLEKVSNKNVFKVWRKMQSHCHYGRIILGISTEKTNSTRFRKWICYQYLHINKCLLKELVISRGGITNSTNLFCPPPSKPRKMSNLSYRMRSQLCTVHESDLEQTIVYLERVSPSSVVMSGFLYLFSCLRKVLY